MRAPRILLSLLALAAACSPAAAQTIEIVNNQPFDVRQPLRLRGMTVGTVGAGGLLPSRHDELGLGLSVLRFIDLEAVSVAFGLFLEGVVHQQRFDSERLVSNRRALGAGYGGLLLVERHLGGGVALRLEGGPVSGLFPRAEVRRGEEVGRALVTPLTWWANGGLVWHW